MPVDTGMGLDVHAVGMDAEDLTEDEKQQLLSAVRTQAGDGLRSITYFTEDTVAQLYLREDLDRTADLVGFAENERQGFRSQGLYEGTQLGEYRFTIRGFEHGYLTRVIVGDTGIWVTTDPLPIDRFDELASALRSVLGEF